MSQSARKLLIVEDDEAVRTQLKYALREEYALFFAESRAAALALVNEVRPDVVSLDPGCTEPERMAFSSTISPAPTRWPLDRKALGCTGMDGPIP